MYRPFVAGSGKSRTTIPWRGPGPPSRDSSGSHRAIAARSESRACQRTPFLTSSLSERKKLSRDTISSLSDERSIVSAAAFLANRPLLERSPETTR